MYGDVHTVCGATKLHIAPTQLQSSVRNSSDVWERLASEVPSKLDAEPPLDELQLHDYQRAGVEWLLGLHDLGVGGILADEMGEVSSA
jgi:SNF2 family DNA or RNA helicase